VSYTAPGSALQAVCLGLCNRLLYASDSTGVFPPTVGHLYPDFCSDGKGFVCPSAGKATPVEHDPHFSRKDYTPAMFGDTHTDYVYVSGLKASDPAHYVLAFEDEWNHDGDGVNVVRAGGYAPSDRDWWPDIKALHEQLARQEKELAAKGRKMKVLRPAWSRYPELPPPRRWYSSPGGRAVAIGAFAAVAVALALVVRTVSRGRERRAEGAYEGDEQDVGQ